MKKIITCLLIVVLGLANASNSDEVIINPYQEQFIITLAANPTTGFEWTLQNYDHGLFKLIASHYVASATNRIGAGGQMQFSFILLPNKVYPKTAVISFKYARSWDIKSATVKNIVINFSKLQRQ